MRLKGVLEMISSFLHHRSHSVRYSMDKYDRIVSERLILIISTSERSRRLEVGSKIARVSEDLFEIRITIPSYFTLK